MEIQRHFFALLSLFSLGKVRKDLLDCECWSLHHPRSGKLRENPFFNELHEEKPNFQNRDFADSIKCQSGNFAYNPSEPNAHGFLLLT